MTIYAAMFSCGTTQVLFSRAPTRPPRTLDFVQPDLRSGGGEKIGRNYLAKGDILDVSWGNMSTAEKDAFLAFWRDTVRGMARPFTYVDPAEVSMVVTFADPNLPEIRERAYNSYEVRCRLRVQ